MNILKNYKVDVYHHFDPADVGLVKEMVCLLREIKSQGKQIMHTQAELVEQVKGATDKLVKIGTETSTLLTKIEELKLIIANGPVSPELQAAVDALTAQAQVVDDLVDDSPTPP